MSFDARVLPVVLLALLLVTGATTPVSAQAESGSPELALATNGTASSSATPTPASTGTASSNAAPAPSNATIEHVAFTGKGTANTSSGRELLWQSSSFEVRVTFMPPDSAGYDVCVWAGTPREQCTEFLIRHTGNRTTTVFDVSEWPGEATGERNVTVQIRRDGEVLAEKTVQTLVLAKQQSYDGDAIANVKEVGTNTSVLVADTDKDSLRDGAELNSYGTDPLDDDTDGDGLVDGREITLNTNPTVQDSDGDGLVDGREVNELSTNPTATNSDQDSLPDGREVEKLETDPNAADTDGDGLGDDREVALDANPLDPDTDGDSLQDGPEVHRHGTSPTNPDTDGDTLSDASEVQLGTDPTSPLTPVTLGTGGIAIMLAGTAFVHRRNDDVHVHWNPNEDGVLTLPRIELDREADSEADLDEEAVDASDRRNPDEPGREPATPDFGAVGTDRETVLQLLQSENGRLRQGQIVDRTDWSASKVSRVLSKMEEDEQISKVTIGRENIVTLYGEEPPGLQPNGDRGSSADPPTTDE